MNITQVVILIGLLIAFGVGLLILNNLPNWIRYNSNFSILTIILFFAVFGFLFVYYGLMKEYLD